MTTNNDKLSPGTDDNTIVRNQRQEPRFSGFDEDDEESYEEPERDTDYSSGYHRADDVEEDEFEDSLEEEHDLFAAEDAQTRYEAEEPAAEEPDAWLEKEGYLEEDEEDEEDGQNWPLSLIAVAIVALILLTAGGYGVMQQRAATQEELTRLRATLATTANPEEVNTSRDALQNLQQSYDKLAANAEALTLENRRLSDTVAGLEAQLGVRQAVLTKTVPPASPAKPAPAPEAAPPQAAAPRPVASAPIAAPATAEPAASQPAATASTGPWFVNFGSYALRSMAETWSTRLHPSAGKVIIAESAKDGKTLYRVRVVGLPSRDAAQEVARKLETDLRMSQLWVGRE